MVNKTTPSQFPRIILILLSNAIPVVGIFFWNWNARNVINLFCIGTFILLFFNAFKLFLIGKYGKDEMWWVWGMFSVFGVGLAITIVTALFIQPQWEEIKNIGIPILISVLLDIISLLLYISRKGYLGENSGLGELLSGTTQIAIIMFLIIPLGFIDEYGKKLSAGISYEPHQVANAAYMVIGLVLVKTFFELRGGFFK